MNQEAVTILNDLVETLKDGEKGFSVAAEDTKDATLKTLFSTYSQERAACARELQSLVTSLGGAPEQGGSVAGAAHRGWINLKAAVTGRDDAAILSECERGEDYAKSDYKKALDKTLPQEIRMVVERQYSAILKSHDRVKALRDQRKAASN
ncbi:PA2169 family four-helix-bundle protein [Chondromyces crocatus]|uniref:DUF2383 domain-containing protein n=1 Tax=Chondromyces crocatus TaxID=52 RepID=A0A0K1ENG0_CHOCO|nr:PA2169 family four-helix-bundle protein [Chondromyces crocatus]AKT42128.1 uncharacterized protein CMC5_063510 [Chondromyces crocatus]